MDMNQINELTDEEKARYMRLSQLFSQPGWQDFVKNYQIKAESAIIAGASAVTWDENRILLGSRLAYEEFANLEESVEDEFALLATERKEKRESTDEILYE